MQKKKFFLKKKFPVLYKIICLKKNNQKHLIENEKRNDSKKIKLIELDTKSPINEPIIIDIDSEVCTNLKNFFIYFLEK